MNVVSPRRYCAVMVCVPIEDDLAGIMRAVPGRMLKSRIQRVSDIEMVAIKAAVESAAREGAES